MPLLEQRYGADDFDLQRRETCYEGFFSFQRFYFCLLYTSPSPRDGLLYRMPSSA